MDEQLIALYHRHVGIAFDRRQRLAAFLEKKGVGKSKHWQYDVPTATLTLGKKVEFEAPLVGSHAEHNHSWLWAWANKHVKLTITNRALGDTVRATFHRLGVHALTAPGFSLEPLLGPELTEHAAQILGVILVGELGYDAYYTMPYDGGQALALIRNDRLKTTEKHPLVRVAMMFPQAIADMPVFDHRAALAGYAGDYGLTVAERPVGLAITDDKGGELTARFDPRGRLVSLEGVTIPAPKPKKKPVANKPAAKSKAKPTPKKPAKPIAKKATKPAAKKPVKAAAKKAGKKR